MIKTKQGLDLPITGSPDQTIENRPPARTVALLGYDYPGMKPTMEVAAGDRVIAGQVVFTDKKTEGVKYTAPATGTVSAINRGAKRAFQSLVIDVEGDESETFASYGREDISGLSRDKAVENLVNSGEWVALRSRPFGKVPSPDSAPRSIFVTAIDTRPLTADPQLFINEQQEAFLAGLDVLSRLTEGPVFVCIKAGANIPRSDNERVRVEEFDGPHPAGLASTHIHFLDPVSTTKTAWHIGYQDVIAWGNLFLSGKVFYERVVALAGPSVDKPRLLRTRLGASTDELTAGEIAAGNHRVISGSVLDGRRAFGPSAFLGRYHNQISALREGTDRELLGFVAPGFNKFSISRLFFGSFSSRNFDLTTDRNGSERAMVPTGLFEEVMPMDILPTQLLRALVVGDVDTSIQLGCLELDEEDLALCTYACAGKYEYGLHLRSMLDLIEKEG
ncbi:MAG: Na(+)-translocating NADH-quinone reductase subunit A [Pseudomonadales bacterium]|nr:Na(+)-translocating NADH-quinone reductase subunit A [Pseudomonadales bacterium]